MLPSGRRLSRSASPSGPIGRHHGCPVGPPLAPGVLSHLWGHPADSLIGHARGRVVVLVAAQGLRVEARFPAASSRWGTASRSTVPASCSLTAQ